MWRNQRFIFSAQQLPVGFNPNSSNLSNGGFTIEVGSSIDAQTVFIPQAVLDHSRTLSSLLLPNCRIINADAPVFALIIEYLHSCITLGVLDFSSAGHLRELTIHENSLLNFAKAWHVGDMLRMPGLKNRLIQVFRTFYLRCLQAQRRPDMRPEALVYLRKHVGRDTKAEKFIIDVLAGLMQKYAKLKRGDFRLLPQSIAVGVRDRWMELTGRGLGGRKASPRLDLKNDRIAAGATSFQDTPGEVARHADFRIQYSYPGPYTSTGLNPPLSGARAVAAKAITLGVSLQFARLRNAWTQGERLGHDFADAPTDDLVRTYSMPPIPSLEASAIRPFLEPATLQHARDMSPSPCPSLSEDDPLSASSSPGSPQTSEEPMQDV